MKWINGLFVALGVLFLLSQFLRPELSNRPVDPKRQLHAPANVQAILDRSCADCHSSQTHWPWYANVSPLSWWLADHVKAGRSEINFSNFPTTPANRAAHKMEEVCEQVEKGEMPIREYLWMHRSAGLSAADKQTICTWAKGEQTRLLAAAP
ncbi:MAG: heme-binding domain-containing protein [Acidobacteriota bacterium]